MIRVLTSSSGGGGGGTSISWFNTVDDRPTGAPADTMVGVRATNTLYRWDGVTWHPIAGSGAQGEISTGTATNLFIQEFPPSTASMLIDSLWIPVDSSGVPSEPDEWQVYTGTGDGDGGNLIISQTAPETVAIDTLYIPLSGAGLTDFYTWKVFSGLGSVVGVGNPNLFFRTTQPAPVDTPTGSLWIPLNTNQTPKSQDTWRVYA